MTASKKLMSAVGDAGEPIYVDSLFSTYLYTGNGSTQDITNGINLADEGGLVWTKIRTDNGDHYLFDTERPYGDPPTVWYEINSNNTNAQAVNNGILSMNSDGYSMRFNNDINASGDDYASWTFRKAPGFFDVVTYTGNATAGRTISHNLGCVPGCIIVKNLNSAENWTVYHRGIDSTAPEDYIIYLNTTAARSDQDLWADTAPTSTEFSVGDNIKVNGNSSNTYVAYLFADGDDAAAQIFGDNGDQAIVKCGSYTGNGSSSGPEIDLGFEPQWLLIKRSDYTSDGWVMADMMRGLAVNGNDNYLYANASNAESSAVVANLTATSFQIKNAWGAINASGGTYIYIAIRRPHKPAESGSEVFAIDRGGQSNPSFVSGFPVDMGYALQTSGGTTYITDRLRGTKLLATSNTNAEASNNSYVFDYMNGMYSYTSGSTAVAHMFKRSPGFFDVVCYTGDGTAGRTVNHNLTVAPEMMIVKRRDAAYYDWVVLDALNTQKLALQDNSAAITDTSIIDNYFGDGSTVALPTDSDFTVGSHIYVNASGGDYIAYLFASQDGISKVFSVTKSSGSNADVNCGFSSGARFVMLKRTDSTGDWYIWDTERGIVSGNDPYLLLNSTAAENTSTDYIDPLSNGFTIVDGGLANGDYIGLAVS